MRKLPIIIIVSLLIGFIGAFFIWPLWDVFINSIRDDEGWTTRYLTDLLTNKLQLSAIFYTLMIACWVTLLCLIICIPLGYVFARFSFPGQTVLGVLLMIPMILPPFVGAVGMKAILARAGPLSTLLMKLGLANGPVDWLGMYPLAGIVILEVLHLFPIMYLNLTSSFANVDPSQEESARNLGASPWKVFRKITFPLAAPGVFAGATLVFIWSFTELGTPLVFGFRNVLPVKIYDNVSEIGSNPIGYAQVVFLLLVTVLGFWLSKKFLKGKSSVSTLGKLSISSEGLKLRKGYIVLVWLLVSLLIFLAILPHISVILISLSRKWFLTIFPHGFTIDFFDQAISMDLTRKAMINSLALASSASIIDIFFGFAIAWLCVRKKIRGADLLDSLAMLPLAVPGLVIAFGYMGCFPKFFPGSILDPRTNPMLLLSMAYAMRRLPYMARACHSGLEQINSSYEEAAANMGASPMKVIRKITIPLIGANILAGAILCFSFSMLEVSDSLILAQTEKFYPLTKAIYVLLNSLENGINIASALGVWAMFLLGSALVLVSCLLGKSLGQVFRSS